MEPTQILWDQIRAKLPLSEVEEVRRMIGSKLIDEVETVAREVDVLEEILEGVTTQRERVQSNTGKIARPKFSTKKKSLVMVVARIVG